MLKSEIEIISAELVEGELHIVCREPSNLVYAVYPSRNAPDKVWKEIYVSDGEKIVLKEMIEGKHTPSKTLPETFTFS